MLLPCFLDDFYRIEQVKYIGFQIDVILRCVDHSYRLRTVIQQDNFVAGNRRAAGSSFLQRRQRCDILVQGLRMITPSLI